MKVGTDGVLLGAWTPLRGDERSALDIGTGTGLIALMLAQRAPQLTVTGIDIDPAAAGEAAGNFRESPWSDRLSAEAVSLRDYVPERSFDLIVSNPPFFKASLKSPDERRRTARHDDTLPPADLIGAALRLLSPNGRLAVIYPPEEARAFVLEAEAAGLFLSRLTRVISVAGGAPRRHLMEFSRRAEMPVFDEIVLHDTADTTLRSEAYRRLTESFYLD